MSRRPSTFFESFDDGNKLDNGMIGYLLASSFFDMDKRKVFFGLVYNIEHALLVGDQVNGMVFIAADIHIDPKENEPMLLLLDKYQFLDWIESDEESFDILSLQWCYSSIADFMMGTNTTTDIEMHVNDPVGLESIIDKIFRLFKSKCIQDIAFKRDGRVADSEETEESFREDDNGLNCNQVGSEISSTFETSLETSKSKQRKNSLPPRITIPRTADSKCK